jgi:hypothetical protein
LSAQYVTLVIDLFAATGEATGQGRAVIVPSGEIPDPDDQMFIGTEPIVVPLWTSSRPSVLLVSTDSVGPQPQGWTYGVSFPGVPGNLTPFSFYLPYSDGATQYLSALAETPAAQPLGLYVPRDGGLPMLGELSPAVVELADAPVIEVDALLGNDFWVTIGGNRTFAAPTNPSDGQKILIEVLQPESGGPFTPAFATGTGGYDFGAWPAPQWSTAPGALDQVAFRYSARRSAWLYLGFGPGF